MKSTFYLFSVILLTQCACSVVKQTKNIPSNSTKDANNVVIVNSKNTINLGSSNDKVIFKGENNIVEINNEGSTFNTKNSNDVLIIEGNQNAVLVNQAGITETSENTNDTIYFKGDRVKSEFVSKSIKSSQLDTINNSNYALQNLKSEDSVDFIFYSLDELILVPDLDSMITIGDAIDFYNSELKKGNLNALFKIGTFYQFGIGTNRNIFKAIECFEEAARNNHKVAQITLGTIYKEGYLNVVKNADKAEYYFKLAEKNRE